MKKSTLLVTSLLGLLSLSVAIACSDDDDDGSGGSGGSAGAETGGTGGGSGGTGGGGLGGGGAGGLGGAEGLLVTDCDSNCAVASEFECPAGSSADCATACASAVSDCGDEMDTYFECVEGEEHTEDNTTCDPTGGLVILDDCALEAAAVVACAAP